MTLLCGQLSWKTEPFPYVSRETKHRDSFQWQALAGTKSSPGIFLEVHSPLSPAGCHSRSSVACLLPRVDWVTAHHFVRCPLQFRLPSSIPLNISASLHRSYYTKFIPDKLDPLLVFFKCYIILSLANSLMYLSYLWQVMAWGDQIFQDLLNSVNVSAWIVLHFMPQWLENWATDKLDIRWKTIYWVKQPQFYVGFPHDNPVREWTRKALGSALIWNRSWKWTWLYFWSSMQAQVCMCIYTTHTPPDMTHIHKQHTHTIQHIHHIQTQHTHHTHKQKQAHTPHAWTKTAVHREELLAVFPGKAYVLF